MKVNSLRITQSDLAALRKAFGVNMFGSQPEFIQRLESTMEYQCATVLNYKLDFIEFESKPGE